MSGRHGSGLPNWRHLRCLAATLGIVVMLAAPLAAQVIAVPDEPSYLMLDATTGRVLSARWIAPDRPVPVGSLIKPFTALAYANAHRFTYPTFVCHGTADRCWLPAGHGRIGIVQAIAESCNAYFHELSRHIASEGFAAVLERFGLGTSGKTVTPAAMVGLGDALELTPLAVAQAYLELTLRAGQPGVAPIIEGLRGSAFTGTGRAVDEALGRTDALVKTGTAPCIHAPKSTADGYAVIVYPADRPRAVLLVHAHGRTGADTARLAGQILARALEVR